MTFQQLTYVVMIARTGSINSAASKLFVSQSSVSNALAQLEDELSTELFVRSKAGVKMTDAGRKFVPYAMSLLERKSELEDMFQNGPSDAAAERLCVTAQNYQCSAAAFVEFMRRSKYKHYHFAYRETDMESVVADVESGAADIGIIIVSSEVSGIANQYLAQKGMTFTPIVEVRPCVFLSRRHPLAHRKELTLNDISRFPYVAFEPAEGVPIDFSVVQKSPRLTDNERSIKTNSRSAMTNVLCNTDAVSIGSGLLVEQIADPMMISIPLSGNDEMMRFGWIGLTETKQETVIQDYLHVLEEVTRRSLEHTEEIWKKKWPE